MWWVRGFLNSGQTNLPNITRFDDLLVTQICNSTRSIGYGYDGLQRLLSATEGGTIPIALQRGLHCGRTRAAWQSNASCSIQAAWYRPYARCLAMQTVHSLPPLPACLRGITPNPEAAQT
jgi:hypothetical protein